MYLFGGVSSSIQKERLKAEGMGTNENAVKFLNQDYEELKRECAESGRLFEDPCFPAVPQSLGFKELAPHSSKTRGVQWKRPTVSVIVFIHNLDIGVSSRRIQNELLLILDKTK